MKRILGIVCLFLCVEVTFAQKVSNITARQVDKQIHITYTLDEPAEISLYLSTDGGESYIKLIKVSGAVGQSVGPGRNTIVWNVLEERENLVGDDIVFKVRADGTTVTDIDGNVYKTVKLGNQVWMAENLRTTRYADGTPIPLETEESSTTAYRYYPDDNSANVSDYGYLYNWAAVMKGASSSANPCGVQGICPDGWHVPSDAEWSELEDYVSSQSQYVCGGDEDYIAKALASEEGWNSYDEECAVGNNPSANNATGFSARPAGKYDDHFGYGHFGSNAYFWSATQTNSDYVYSRYLDNSSATVDGDINSLNFSFGYSVRCVRNVGGSGSEGGSDNEDTTDTTITVQPCPGAPTVTDVDGNVYNTVQIGEQCWMRENLKTTKYANGTTIPLGTEESYDVAYRCYPNNNSANVSTYGYLYNWAAVMKGASSSSANPSGVQGICPDGWHVPSYAEWSELEDYVRSQSQYVCGCYGSSYIAKALASEEGWYSSPEGWDSGTFNCAVGNNPSTNNATGFSARPAGYYVGRFADEVVYGEVGVHASFWSATQSFSDYAYSRNLSADEVDVYCYDHEAEKSHGYSVRCVRNVGGSGSEGGSDNEDTTDTTVTAQPCPGAPTVTDIDGNVYKTVKLGNQVWMAENLRTTRYANGTTIPLGTEKSYDVAYRYYPNGNSANVADYGYLYNWAAVMNGSASSKANPSGVQGICPDGWHVPSDAEWTELTNYVSRQSQYVCGVNTNYIAKALASETGWISSTKNCAVGNNPSTNNATFFSARPAGYYGGSYSYFGNAANFWSATQGISDYAYDRYLNYFNAGVYRGNSGKNYGYSVRCIRN